MNKITREMVTFTGINKNYPEGTREMIRIPTKRRPLMGALVTPEEFAKSGREMPELKVNNA